MTAKEHRARCAELRGGVTPSENLILFDFETVEKELKVAREYLAYVYRTEEALDRAVDAQEATEAERDVEQKKAVALFYAFEERTAERDALRAAIETHRYNIWGAGRVGHEEDARLYAALLEKKS